MDHIKEIISALQEKVSKESNAILVGNKQIGLDVGKIKEIEEGKDGFVGFIDGGNAELLKGANFSVQFIRVFGSVYNGLQKMHTFKQEFFVLIHAVVQEGGVFFEIVPFGTEDKFEKVDAHDQELTSKHVMVNVSAVGGIVRRISELRLAKVIAEKMKDGVLVLDGDLEVKHKYEAPYLEGLKKNTVVGLSKTTQLLTNSGDSAVAVLAGMGKGRWYYDSKSEISFVRLHEKSNYVFRMDVFDFRKIKEIAGMLARYATDPVFLGYPYGLVEADRYARVSNEEKEYLKTRFLAEAGDLGRYLRAQDAHSVLDSIG